MELTLEKYAELKKNYLEMVTKGTMEAGGLPPHITLFAHHKNNESKHIVIHVPVTDELMTPAGKTKLFDVAIPLLGEQLRDLYDVYALAWSSEAWVREAKGDQKDVNWQDIPIKKEVIIISFESSVKNELVLYEMKRQGHKVSDSGELIDNIELVQYEPDADSFGGNITGLLEKFRQV